MAIFRNINYARMLYETLRKDFAVNRAGNVSIFYKYLYVFLISIQTAFSVFDTWRIGKQMIANCKWQIGQLTNVLNYIYDSTLSRIYISQMSFLDVYDLVINGYEAIHFDEDISVESTLFEPTLNDKLINSAVIIHVPASIYSDSAIMSNLTSTIEQIKITGLTYQIVSI